MPASVKQVAFKPNPRMNRTTDNKIYRSATLLGVLAIGMFGFAYGLVPLYEVFCEFTGINGKTAETAAEMVETTFDSGREVKVQFLGRVGNGMPWEFRPSAHEFDVTVGRANVTEFYARNRSAHTVVGQAVPSVSPGLAAEHLKKVECLCFPQQTLEPGEETYMPVKFYVSNDLPAHVRTITLSYTMFKVSRQEPAASTNHLASLVSANR